MKPRNTREMVVLIFAVTVAVAILGLVGAGVYAVIANTIDWTTDHVKGPNLTSPLATLIGSLMSAVIAGTVGYISGRRGNQWEVRTGTPPTDPVIQIGSTVNDIVDKLRRVDPLPPAGPPNPQEPPPTFHPTDPRFGRHRGS